MSKLIGVLTAGGDTPGLNAALRGLGKAAVESLGYQIIGFKDGFRGLMQNQVISLDGGALSGILTLGGTILGTSRDKPHQMSVGGKIMDMTDAIIENYRQHHLDALVCLGGGGTQKSAYRLMQRGLNVVTLPKTIDNDVAETDVTFGFDTALSVATEAIDRLHSTAHSHHRIIVVEIMGHNAGWLALGSGLAGGADVILIPEMPYSAEKVAEAILRRSRGGKRFSIVAVSEGAMSLEDALIARQLADEKKKKKENGNGEKKDKDKKKDKTTEVPAVEMQTNLGERTIRLANRLQELTGLEARVTILGHLQRGGAPSAADRLLATHLGTAAAELIAEEQYGVMVASRGGAAVPVPLEKVAGNRRIVPLDHPWLDAARRVGTNLGE